MFLDQINTSTDSLTSALSQCLDKGLEEETKSSAYPAPWEVYHVLNECHLALIAGEVSRQHYKLQNLDQTISLIIVLEGSIKISNTTQPLCNVPEGHVTLVMPRESELDIDFGEDMQHVALFLDLDTSFLDTVLSEEEFDLLGKQLGNIHDPQPSLLNLNLPLTKPIYDIVYNLVQSPQSARFRQMLVESRAYELVAIILQDLLSHTHVIGETNMPVEVIRSIQKAHQIVIENFASPPTLNQLSRQVGINRNKLSRGFKLLYGATVFEYCHNYRMTLAQTLLQKSSHSIAYVAELTGYDHPGNFTTAYKRHYGKLPKQTRLGTSL